MKNILEFNNFVKKYKKVNEGGGAGKDIKFSEINYDLMLVATASGIQLQKKEVSVDETIDIVGYQDGLSNIYTDGLFDVDLEYSINFDKFKNLTVAKIKQYSSNLFSDVDDDVTMGDMLSGENAQITLRTEGGGAASYMYGGGWILQKIKKDETIKIDVFEIGDGGNEYLNGANVIDLLSMTCDLVVNVVLKATDKMENMWNDIFEPQFYSDYIANFDGNKADMLSEEDFYSDQEQALKDLYCKIE